MLARILILIIGLTMGFCISSKTADKKKYELPSDSEINAVLKEIVDNDTDFISNKQRQATVFSSDLRKYPIQLPQAVDSTIVPTFINHIAISQLIYEPDIKKPFFSKPDSLYFLFQSDSTKPVNLDIAIFKKYKLLSINEINRLFKTENKFTYYEFSIPYFSVDKTKAHVEFSYVCGSLCGRGGIYLLQKINGKWIIVSTHSTWVS
jgi:hypothetical protein